MRFGLTLRTAPAVEPVTLDEAKAHLRVWIDDDDAYITALITAARIQIERAELSRALITQTWSFTFDGFPADLRGVIEIPRPPLQEIVSIQYVDATGATQTLAPSDYQIDALSEPARVAPAFGKYWPITRLQMNTVTIEFKAGYGDTADDVPDPVRMAIKQLAAHWYDQREPVVLGQMPAEVPMTVAYLLADYKVRSF